MKIDIGDIFLSDDSREFSRGNFENGNCKKNGIREKRGIFVKTRQNARFVDSLDSRIEIISPSELKKYLQNNLKIIGITGTNGKTTIASALYSLSLSLGFRAALLGTRGFFINDKQAAPKGLTTPSLLELYNDIHIASKMGCDFFIMEVSSHAIAQERIEGLEFALKILSNITSDHLDFHKSIEEYTRVKNSFFSDEGMKLINKDALNARFNVANSYTYGIENAANLAPSAYSVKNNINAHIVWNDFYRKVREDSMLASNLIGKHNLYNILASVAAMKILEPKLALSDIARAMEDFGGVRGRMEIVHQNPLIIVDFAHTPDGMKNIFEAFLGAKIKVVFGAGGNRDTLKRPQMGAIAQHYAQKIYLTSDNPRNENPDSIINDILGGISRRENVVVEPNRRNAILRALSELASDEVLLILGKGDEKYQIIGEEKLPFDDVSEVQKFYEK